MYKIVYKAVLLSILLLSVSNELQAALTFRIEITKDTIYIGEPIVVKCIIVNNSNHDAQIWASSAPGLLSADRLTVDLQIPHEECNYRYSVYLHASPIGPVPQFSLPPQDSVYFYAILAWSDHGGFVGDDESRYRYLTYDEYSAGFYRIKATYSLPVLQLDSNIDDFYATAMPLHEADIFRETGDLIDRFFGWPHNIGNDIHKVRELFPKYVKKDTSVMAQFCHYVLAFCAPLKNQTGLNRIRTGQAFLRNFPNTPLAEQIKFWQAKSLAEIGQKEPSKELLHAAQMRYPDNIIGFLYRNAMRKEPIPISIGLTVTDDAHLRVSPDTVSNIVTLLGFGEPFLIFEKEPFMEGNREWHWYKVTLMDRETKGWIVSKEGREGSLKLVDLESDDYAGLYFRVGEREMWGYREYEAAERLFLYVLRTYGNRKVRILDHLHGHVQYDYANMNALEKLAMLHGYKKEFREAIEYCELKLRQKEATEEDTISTKYQMMRVYLDALQENEQVDEAMQFYHHIIRDFRETTLSGYEGWKWLDIEAAEYLVEVLSTTLKDTSRLLEECEQIVEETANPAVFLIATKGIIIAQLHSGNYDLAKLSFLKAISKYPQEGRFYWKEDYEDYTALLIADFMWLTFDNDRNYETLEELADLIEASTSGSCRLSVDKEHDWLMLDHIVEFTEPRKKVVRYSYKYSLWHGGLLRSEAKEIRK